MNRRFSFGLESLVLAVHVCYSFLVMEMLWIGSALRRSRGGIDGVLEARNRECCSCFSQFKAVLLKIANAGSANAVPGLGFSRVLLGMVPFLMVFREPL